MLGDITVFVYNFFPILQCHLDRIYQNQNLCLLGQTPKNIFFKCYVKFKRNSVFLTNFNDIYFILTLIINYQYFALRGKALKTNFGQILIRSKTLSLVIKLQERNILYFSNGIYPPGILWRHSQILKTNAKLNLNIFSTTRKSNQIRNCWIKLT